MYKAEESQKEGWLFKQSSELEILISAAIVFAAFQIHDLVPQLIATLLNNNLEGNSAVLLYVVMVALFLGTLLPISIFAHFIIRFYWLSLVGLRTAFTEVQKRKMDFAPRYMQKTFQSEFIDNHIQTIDKICSSIFAFSFLVIFAFCFSLFTVLFVAGFLIYLAEDVFSDSIFGYFFLVLAIIFLVMSLLTFIDFFTMGSLKKIKKKWFIKFYYPVYKIMGWLTFSFFYKGIYYTFIQKVSKKALAILLPAYVILALVLLNLGYYENRLYAEDSLASDIGNHAIVDAHYSENFNDATAVHRPFISSFVSRDNFLELSIPVSSQLDERLITNCDRVIAINKEGFHWRKWLTTGFNRRDLPDNFDYLKNAKRALECFSSQVSIKIDTVNFDNQKFRFKKIYNPEKIVVTTFIDISDLKRGEHLLTVRLDTIPDANEALIPFLKN